MLNAVKHPSWEHGFLAVLGTTKGIPSQTSLSADIQAAISSRGVWFRRSGPSSFISMMSSMRTPPRPGT